MALSIHAAAMSGNLEEVKRLIQQDPRAVHRPQADSGFTPLHRASDKGHVEVVAWLLDHGGGHINKKTSSGATALLLACLRGHLPVVELLSGRGAKHRFSYHVGGPLTQASCGGNVDVVRFLLHQPQFLSTINWADDTGKTALHGACYNGDHADVVRELLEAGADPTMASGTGETPVDIARQKGHHVCVELLEEWERHYLLTKARHLHDASHDVSQTLAHKQIASSSSTTTAKMARLEATPTYLMGRVEKGQPLPVVMVEVADGGRRQGDTKVKEMDSDLLVKVVLEYVVCGGLRGELFVELMEEVLGVTGYRKDRTKEKGKKKGEGGGNATAAAAPDGWRTA